MIRIGVILLLLAPATGWAESCVTNSSDHSHLFAVSPSQGDRLMQTLAPGERLCSPTRNGAILSVFENADAFEGCSRLVGPDQSDRLMAYAEFDRCHWASHDR
ncbi:hypothetical protein O2N63_10435 [Aliiroseovarius sp. KMU-50]|uniref:Uncharacterized protein n=1 Tax=Aliiroseovarius salicola TaxID=3009082 RepID=A0ABT4W3X5_9RHOB|nr:hypothetical protein [Aliiroseovarius sp. KMU-50]MDA5094502.1 hypothetical protein [Aliiroseovarius sp. KMU-50]